MRVSICTHLMFMALRSVAGPETTNTSLSFYVVSEGKIEGGTFIDTPDLPNTGYISAKPDLVITNLEDVYRQKIEDNAIIVDKDGNQTVVPSHPSFGLVVKLRAEDAKQFGALTERSIGRRLLVALGDKPLTAPVVRMPIESGSLAIQFRNEEELKKTETGFKRLVR